MSRIAITAFSGWNDAGEAATGVIEHLLEVWPSRPVGAVDAEEFIDFQVNRPEIRTTEEGPRVVDWPDTRLHLITPPRGPEIVAVLGPEPSLRWKRFCDEVLEQPAGARRLLGGLPRRAARRLPAQPPPAGLLAGRAGARAAGSRTPSCIRDPSGCRRSSPAAPRAQG
ncbi:PAC2 family protein [Brachybacterium sp. GPGPB12]|uniref:PAC2 family protein n=1 Tax=Brachybacterium sp. GPGPB12 TaxID=3023517 RepID=UPI0031346160